MTLRDVIVHCRACVAYSQPIEIKSSRAKYSKAFSPEAKYLQAQQYWAFGTAKAYPTASHLYVTEVKKTKECNSGLITCSSLQARMTNCYAHILGVLRYLINPEADDVPGAVREANLSPADRAAARNTLLQVRPCLPE